MLEASVPERMSPASMPFCGAVSTAQMRPLAVAPPTLNMTSDIAI